jgi:hypothetical protein
VLAVGGSVDWWTDISGFDASGFSIFTRNAGGNNGSVAYLALNFNGVINVSISTEDTPTGSGNLANTAPGFIPQAVLLGTTIMEAVASAVSDRTAGTVGQSFITENAQFSLTGSSEDLAATMNTQSLNDNQALLVPDDDGTAHIAATFVSFDANGYTLNYSAFHTSATKQWVLAFESEGAAALSIDLRDDNDSALAQGVRIYGP